MKLDIKGIQFDYGSTPVLNDVNLELGSGEIMSLTGPNGSGKTTLLKCINRIIKPKCGMIRVAGDDISQASLKKLALYMAYVPQSAPTSFPLTVFDTILLGRKPHVTWKLSGKDKKLAFEVLEIMGMKDMSLRLFNELSGGEKQKVLIARAICQEPQVLILDEPTSNLDLRHQLEVLNIITDLVREKNLSAVMAMHDLNLVARFSTRVAMLKKGHIYATGKPCDVLTPDNIREVYGVESEVGTNNEMPYIIPVSPVGGNCRGKQKNGKE